MAIAVAVVLTPSGPGEPPVEGIVWIPGGTFHMGTDQDVQDSHHSRPRRSVTVGPFWMARHEVTNRQFEEFVAATGYQTVAERMPKREDFPDAPEEALVPFSAVFSPPERVRDLADHLQWWAATPGANWRHPEGPDSSIDERMEHPVVHVCWYDAVAYCEWLSEKAGKTVRLPTEAEWEFAGRGGLADKEFVWGDEAPGEGGAWQANIWQGDFPHENTKEDGYVTTAPVGSYPPNGYGLYDMSGNVWEWCQDWYQPDYYRKAPKENPTGPVMGTARRPGETATRVQRGGSFLCCDSYCRNYRTWTRHSNTPDSAANHIGFRFVVEP